MSSIPSFVGVPLVEQDARAPAAPGPADAPAPAAPGPADVAAFVADLATATGHAAADLVWSTPEGIAVAPVQVRADLEALVGGEHPHPLGSFPGSAPFLRGPYPAMYVTQPWTIRQYAGFSTAQESNAFYRRNLAAGQRGLSVAFDLRPTAATTPTIRGSPAMSAWPVWPSIPSWTCGSCSTPSDWTRSASL